MNLDRATRVENFKAKQLKAKVSSSKTDALKNKVSEKLTDVKGQAKDKASEALKKGVDKLKDAGRDIIESKATTFTRALGLTQDVATSLGSNLADLALSPNEKEDEKKPDEAKLAELKANEEKKQEELKKEKLEKENIERRKKIEAHKSGAIKLLKPPPPKEEPAVIFIKGLQMFGISSNYDGIEDMAQAYPKAEVFDWDQKEEIHHKISRTAPGQPVVLIGHSLGADTAVEIANELNSIDNRFRRVNLLVTLDSVGINNDIVPQNVTKNMNFISDSWLGDSPNIARNIKMTSVENDLRPEGHTDLDNAQEIQANIIQEIDSTLI